MMEKVKVTRQQAEELEEYKSRGELQINYLINIHSYNKRPDLGIANMTTAKLARALLIGYEVEPEFKVGDKVFIKASPQDLKTIEEIVDGNEAYLDRSIGRFDFEEIRHATPSEIAAEKERRWWKKHGRDVWELRKGDVLQNKHTGLPNIAVVESFIDGKPSFGLKEINYKKNYYVVCFAENRLDVDVNES